jgi:uncharacterized protein (TIGR03435 family)
MRAYDVRIYQIEGGSGAAMDIADIPYDIVAKAEGDRKPTTDQIRGMLQALLADRFQLKIHRETKEVPAYVLVQGKKGSKLKESDGNTKNSIRFITGSIEGSLTASKETMTQFALYLSIEAGRPVSDKTELTGNYDFTLAWTRDQNQPVLGSPAPAAEPNALSPESNGPSIFKAVQEQLGLRLEPQKSPIDFLVIDHLAKPSEN